jgi:hypothetical protein
VTDEIDTYLLHANRHILIPLAHDSREVVRELIAVGLLEELEVDLGDKNE